MEEWIFLTVAKGLNAKCMQMIQLYMSQQKNKTKKKTQIAAEMLSKELEGVSQWLRDNHLTLNYDKTVSMCFSIKRNVNENFRIKVDDKEIEEVHEFKFLGIILDSHFQFDRHVKRLCRTVRTNLNCF